MAHTVEWRHAESEPSKLIKKKNNNNNNFLNVCVHAQGGRLHCGVLLTGVHLKLKQKKHYITNIIISLIISIVWATQKRHVHITLYILQHCKHLTGHPTLLQKAEVCCHRLCPDLWNLHLASFHYVPSFQTWVDRACFGQTLCKNIINEKKMM